MKRIKGNVDEAHWALRSKSLRLFHRFGFIFSFFLLCPDFSEKGISKDLLTKRTKNGDVSIRSLLKTIQTWDIEFENDARNSITPGITPLISRERGKTLKHNYLLAGLVSWTSSIFPLRRLIRFEMKLRWSSLFDLTVRWNRSFPSGETKISHSLLSSWNVIGEKCDSFGKF